MGYADILDVENVLGQAMTTAKPDGTLGRVPLTQIGRTRDPNSIPTEIVLQYLEIADQEIDSVLSQQYYTPFTKCSYGQWYLESDIPGDAGDGGGSGSDGTTSTSHNQVTIGDTSVLIEGDVLIIHNDITGEEETVIVATKVDQYSFMVTADIHTTFLASDGVRVIRSSFPPPLTWISARLAAANIYDKYFSAQSAPNVSEYGDKLREMAYDAIDDILNGKTIVKCGKRKGDHLASPYLDSSYTHRRPLDGYSTQDRTKSRSK